MPHCRTMDRCLGLAEGNSLGYRLLAFPDPAACLRRSELEANPVCFLSAASRLRRVVCLRRHWQVNCHARKVPCSPLRNTSTFKYDPLGRRIYKSSSTATSVYAYDGDNLIEETNATGSVVALYEQTQNIDEPLAMLRSNATSYFHADGLGSITSLSNAAGLISLL